MVIEAAATDSAGTLIPLSPGYCSASPPAGTSFIVVSDLEICKFYLVFDVAPVPVRKAMLTLGIRLCEHLEARKGFGFASLALLPPSSPPSTAEEAGLAKF